MPATSDHRLLEVVGLIYDAAHDPARYPDAMTAIARHFNGNSVFFAQDTAAPDADCFESGGFDEARLDSYVRHFASTNPWLPQVASMPAGTLVISEHLVDCDRFERSEFYNDWLKPQDLYYSLGAIIANDDRRQTNLSVLRPRAARSYRPHELAAWRVLSVHFGRALQIHRLLAAARLQRNAAVEGLDRQGIAAFLVDADARILWANDQAILLLEAGDGLTAPGNRLAAARPPANERLRHLVAQAAAAAAGRGLSPGAALALPRRDRRPLSALVSPFLGDTFGFAAPAAALPAALVFVRDTDRPAHHRSDDLKTLYGLTEAEARLAMRLADGESVQQIAAASGVSPQTLRTHLKRLMRKADVTRQSELVILLLKSATTLARPTP